MPRVKFDYVVSFSSEDPEHKANNLLEWEVSKKRWLCAAGEPSCSVVLQLKAAVQISAVTIGAYQAAMVEVLVGRSEQPNDPFQVLVPRSVVLSPRESRAAGAGGAGGAAGGTGDRVRSFSGAALCELAAARRWDRLRVVCSQPYNKHCQYGLSFVHVDSSEEPPPSAAPAPAPARLLPLPRYSSDEEEFTPGELFAKHRSSQDKAGLTSSDAQIRQASSQALKNISDSAIKLVKTSISKNHSNTESRRDAEPNGNRRSEKLMYADDDDKPHAKIDRVVQRHKDEKSKDITEHKKDKKHNDKPSNGRSQFDDFLSDPNKKVDQKKRDDSSNRRSNHDRNKPAPCSERNSEVPSAGAGRAEETSRKRTHSGRKQDEGGWLAGVVFCLSGYENPRRAALRAAAVAAGAEYCPSWGPRCTHLICAFPNTPKLKSIRAEKDGERCIAVRGEWVEACAAARARLPWRPHATEPRHRDHAGEDRAHAGVDRGHAGKDRGHAGKDRDHADYDTDDEIEKVLRNEKKRKHNRDDDVSSSTVPAGDDVTDDARNAHENSVKDTSRDSDVAFVRDERIQGNITLQDSDSEATDTERDVTPRADVTPLDDVTLVEARLLPDVFGGARFLLSDDVTSRDLVLRYVTAYGGTVLEPELLEEGSEVDYILCEKAPSVDVKGLVVRVEWLWACHQHRTLWDTAEYLLQ